MSNDLLTGLEKWWKSLTTTPTNPLEDKLGELEERLRAQEEKEEGTEKGAKGAEGAEGREGSSSEGAEGREGSSSEGAEGREGPTAEVNSEGAATEDFGMELDNEGKVTNKVVTKKSFKKVAEEEGFSTKSGLTIGAWEGTPGPIATVRREKVAGVGTTESKGVLSNTKDVEFKFNLEIEIELAGGEGKVTVQAEQEEASLTINNSSLPAVKINDVRTIIVKKGQEVTIKANISKAGIKEVKVETLGIRALD